MRSPFSAAGRLHDLVLLHTTIARRLDSALAARPRPDGEGRVLELGPDPLRVLLTGAGLAVGYGVSEREHGLGGAVARALHRETDRGVVVEHRVQANLPMREVVALLGGVGAHTYHLVIWCPTFTDLPRTWRLQRWLIDLRRIMTSLVESGDARTDYLLVGYPEILDDGVAEAIASAFVRRVNTRISRVAGEFPRTRFRNPPPVVNIGRALDADYYTRCAEQILPAVLELLQLTRVAVTNAASKDVADGGEPARPGAREGSDVQP